MSTNNTDTDTDMASIESCRELSESCSENECEDIHCLCKCHMDKCEKCSLTQLDGSSQCDERVCICSCHICEEECTCICHEDNSSNSMSDFLEDDQCTCQEEGCNQNGKDNTCDCFCHHIASQEEEKHSFSTSQCDCEFCRNMHENVRSWEQWVPQSSLEKSIKQMVDRRDLLSRHEESQKAFSDGKYIDFMPPKHRKTH